MPVDSTPIENGAIAVHGGLIDSICAWHKVTRVADVEVIDFGDAAIVPGFVNAHTHLELTNLARKVPPTPDFPHWILRLAKLIAVEANAQEQVEVAVREGVRQSLAVGVTTIGDIARRPQWSRAALSQTSIRAVSYGEVIAVGAIRNRLDVAVADAMNREWQSERVRVGLSPHSPYTVEQHGLRECARRANAANAALDGQTNPLFSPLGKGGEMIRPPGEIREIVDDSPDRTSPNKSIPLCVHLAETLDEERFTLQGDGPIADLLKSLGVWDEHIPMPRLRPVELARHCGLLTPRTLLAHANYVNDDDIQLIVRSGASVAYCPRTHHAFGHAPHRFREMIAAGMNVCLGTDSLASNPSLSVLDELRFLRERHPDVLIEMVLAMGTLNGAKALGFEDECGSLMVGKSADLVVLPLERPASSWDEMFHSNVQPVAVFAGGRRVEASDINIVTPFIPPCKGGRLCTNTRVEFIS
ncbi:MAG: amidohydrolase family protein [Planctomycetes bacterium]|nr:amidohydrolase family protein [Planctomycetota bacterium]